MITTRIRFTYPPLIQHPHTARRLPLNILAAALIVFGLACGVQAQPVISSQAGYTITWDGNDGEYSGLSVPNNAAKASNGSQAFGSGQLIADGTAGQHMTNVNNGTYGNGSSWINGTFDVPSPLDTASPAGGATSFIGIRFTNTIAISSIAWGRDNTTGGASDRWQTVYTLQVTTVANPDGGTTTTGNAATGWVTIGTVTTGNAQTNATFRAWLRHRYNVAQGGNPIPATGMRIVCAWNAAAIDEIEVNAPVPKTWTGNGGANLWDINTSANWLDAGGSTAGGSTYVSYVFFDNDVVTFGDNGGTNLVVNINSTVSPASTTVNATTNYTFTGTGGIGGTNSLIKLGAGTLTLSTVNTYTGSTTLSNGTLSVASIANGGVNSGLGSSANAAANLVFAGGTLSYSGTTNTSSDRNFTINNATIGIVNVANAAAKLTLTGTTPTTNGTLRVTGPGTLTLDSGTSTTLNGLIIASGTNELKSGTLILRNVGASVGTTNGFVNAGHFLLTGGSVISTNSAGFILFPAGRYDITGAGNSFVQNGGVFDGGNSAVYNAYNTSGSTYINSGIFNCGRFSLTYGTTGILNLNGGICSVNYIDAQSSGAPQVNFNGGTLLAKQATTQFIGLANGGTNIPAVYIQSGGAFIDSSNNAVTIPVALKTDATSLGGGLTKLGTGTLNLSGANTYSGNTFISAGTLALSVGGLITNTASITVASNAIFDVSGLTGGSLPFTLGIPLTTQTLSNSAPGAIINGTNNCSAGTISLVYDGVNPSFTITNGGMTLSASTTFKVNKTGAALPLGVYKLIAKATAGNVGLVGGTVPAVTVNNGLSQATLGIVGGELYLTNGGPSTISYGSTSFTYNGSAQTPTITFSGSTAAKTTNYVGTGSTTYSSVNPPTSAGTYYVSNTVAADASYFGAINSANFTISAKAASVTADTKTKTYGSVNPVLTAVTNGAVNGDVINVTIATTATQYSSVGVSNITVTAGINPNYTVLTTNSTLTISTRPITLTAQPNTKVYDGGTSATNVPTLTSGTLASGDGFSSLSEAYADATVGTGKTVIPSATITNASGTVTANYAITLVNDTTSVINPAQATTSLLLTNNVGVTNYYGQTLIFTAVVQTNSVNAANASSNVVFSLGSTPVWTNAVVNGVAYYTNDDLTVGTTNFTAQYLGDNNYLSSSLTATQTVLPATPTLTLTAGAITNGQTLGSSSLSGSVATNSYDLDADGDEAVAGGFAFANPGLAPNAGATNVWVIFTPDDTTNYTTASNTVSVTVNKASSSVTVTGTTSFTYNGAGQGPASASVTGSSGALSYSYSGTGYGPSSNTPTNAGSYTVTATVAADDNYNTATSSPTAFNISPASASVTADAQTKNYGDVNPALTATEAGTVNGDVLNYTLATDAAQFSSVGVSNITVTLGSNPNYSVLTTNSTLTINPAATFVGASSTNNPSGYKDSVAFLATLPTDATGSVVFSSTNGPISTNTLSSGSVTSLSITNLARGTNVITVAYLGDGNYIGSTNTLDQVVTNHPPVAVDATYYRAKGLSLKIEITNLLSNVTDADGDTNTLQSVGAGLTNATIMTDSTCVYYLPGTGTGSNDNDVVSYTVSDGFGGTATANILVNVFSAAGPAQMSLPTNGVVNITFFGIPNYTYVVQTTTNLSVPWWTLSTNTAGTNGIWQFTDPNATNAQQYYRSSQP